MTIRAIFFDLGNVLVMFDARRAAAKFVQKTGVSFKDVWKCVFISRAERDFTKGKISSREFVRCLNRQLPKKISYPHFVEIWNNIFWPNPEMEDLLKHLKKRYHLYLISNTNELHFKFIQRNFTVLKHFKRCFPSHWVGCRKPEQAIFRHALRIAKVKPEEAVFIDDMPDFVKGARRVGIKAIRFGSRKQIEKELLKLGVKI